MITETLQYTKMKNQQILKVCFSLVVIMGAQCLPIISNTETPQTDTSTTTESLASVFQEFLREFNQTGQRAMFLGIIDSGDNSVNNPAQVSSSGDAVAIDASIGDVIARFIVSGQQQTSQEEDYDIYEGIYSDDDVTTAATVNEYDISKGIYSE